MTHQTDREMLELAAKAAGLKRAEYWCSAENPPFPFAECITHEIEGEPCIQVFNSLSSSQDAFELLVMAEINLVRRTDVIHGDYFTVDNMRNDIIEWVDRNPSENAAARRAITRAAAEIGAQLP